MSSDHSLPSLILSHILLTSPPIQLYDFFLSLLQKQTGKNLFHIFCFIDYFLGFNALENSILVFVMFINFVLELEKLHLATPDCRCLLGLSVGVEAATTLW